jgi:hypothetical protein
MAACRAVWHGHVTKCSPERLHELMPDQQWKSRLMALRQENIDKEIEKSFAAHVKVVEHFNYVGDGL